MKRILIVDDELLIADTIAVIFRHHGFDVRTAYCAADGLLTALAFRPELLVCDVSMPGRSGLELMHDIARELPACKIIILSAQHANRTAVADQSRTMPQAPTFLLKPCHPLDLIREAGAALASAAPSGV